MPYTDEQKVAFATHLLKGGAEYWWRSAKTYLQTQGTHMNWEQFEVAFLDKYYPKSARRQKELEFVHLQQGDMSIAEYVAKFEELARFSPHAQYAPTEEWKINQFEWGLRPEIRGNIGHMELTNYSTFVHKSYIVEDNLKKVQEERQVKWQQKKESEKFGQQLKVKTPQGKGKQVQTSSSPRTKKCLKCGRDHGGECLVGKQVCYYCKQPGHMAPFCPIRQKQAEFNPNKSNTGRVFALSAKKVLNFW